LKQEIVQVDAFTSEPYRGNPAAVCVLEKPADEEWMRLVAREMNLSETAFVYPIDQGYHLRWLTPKSEVDLCGHGTLATAHLLWEDGHVPAESEIHFKTRSGWVSAARADDWNVLDFPVNPLEPIPPPQALVKALGFAPLFVGHYPKGYLVVASSDQLIRDLKPSLSLLEELPEPKVCVTARDSSGNADFVSRLFAPSIGIPEDPVNGNSHTVLAPYWAGMINKKQMTSVYASARGGIVGVELAGDRVKIKGQAVTVMRGKLLFYNV
jgi:predicted PhzF superfamily epimerase YddE/YHI9